MNLISILTIIPQKAKTLLVSEHKNLFCWLVSFFILGLLLAAKILENNNFIIAKQQLILSLIVLCFSLLLLIYLSFKKIKRLKVLCIIFIFASGGFLLLSYKAFNNKTVFLQKSLKFAHLSGEVVSVVKYNNSRFSSIYLKNVTIENYKAADAPTNLKLTTYYKTNLNKGDIITVWANLQPIYSLTPFENTLQTNAFWQNFGATGFIISRIKVIKAGNYLGTIGTVDKSIIQKYINQVRNYFLQKINNNLTEDTKGIATAITLGGYTNINKQDRENLISSGLSPFIAISGLHIGIITAFIFLVVRLGLALIPIIALKINTKKVAAIVTIIILCGYLLLLQSVPSAYRAGAMAILLMFGVLANVPTISIRNLLLAALILLLLKPEYISSTSFLLSFTATGAIIVLFNNKQIKNITVNSKHNLVFKVLSFIILTALLSLIVGIALFPLIVYFFGKVPLYGILANLVVIPLFSLVIMPFLLLALILPTYLAYPLFKVVDLTIVLMLKIASLVSNLNFSTIYFAGLPNILLIGYIGLFLIFISSATKLRYLAVFLVIPIFLYIFLQPYPNIMIDKTMKQIAFLNNNNNYVFNTLKGGSFIRRVWLKGSKRIEPKNLKNSKDFYCDNSGNCLIGNKPFLVSFNNDINYLPEACYEANLIIVKGNSAIKCNKALIIDRLFLQKYGSSFIYFIKPHTIKIKSNQKTIIFNAAQ